MCSYRSCDTYQDGKKNAAERSERIHAESAASGQEMKIKNTS
jgi:hypothetical protein